MGAYSLPETTEITKLKKGIKYLAPGEEIYYGLSDFKSSFDLKINYDYYSEDDNLVNGEETVPIEPSLLCRF